MLQSVIDEPANDPVYGTSSGGQDEIGFNTSPTDAPDTTDAPADDASTEAVTEAPAAAEDTNAPAEEATTVASAAETARPAREFRTQPSSFNSVPEDEGSQPSLPAKAAQLLQMLLNALVSSATHKPKAKSNVRKSSTSKSSADSLVARSRLSTPFLLRLPTPSKPGRILSGTTSQSSSTTKRREEPVDPFSFLFALTTNSIEKDSSRTAFSSSTSISWLVHVDGTFHRALYPPFS